MDALASLTDASNFQKSWRLENLYSYPSIEKKPDKSVMFSIIVSLNNRPKRAKNTPG